jgi:hypothetical protein
MNICAYDRKEQRPLQVKLMHLPHYFQSKVNIIVCLYKSLKYCGSVHPYKTIVQYLPAQYQQKIGNKEPGASAFFLQKQLQQGTIALHGIVIPCQNIKVKINLLISTKAKSL